MRNIILILLVFLAVFTYFRAYEPPSQDNSSKVMTAEVSVELPVEIPR
jgi:hypothetical protein